MKNKKKRKEKKKEGYTPHGPKKEKKKKVGIMEYIFNLKKQMFCFVSPIANCLNTISL
jgi:hypothetical protein